MIVRQKRPYTTEQLRFIYRQYLLEQAKIVHRIFDNVINFTRKYLSNAVITDTYPEGRFFTGYVYDPNSFICKPGPENTHHPIYVQFDNEPEETYEAYIPTRRVANVNKSKLRHDPIVVHLNVPVIRNYAGNIPTVIQQRIPSLLAHELTHSKDMWTSDFINVIDNLIDLGYHAVTRRFLDDEDNYNVSDADIRTVNAMLYFMSPAETNATYEAYDKYLKYLSDGQLLQMIGDEFGTETASPRAIAARIFSLTKEVARINNTGMLIRLEDYAVNDCTVPVLFTAFAVYLGFIPDKSGYFADFSFVRAVTTGEYYPDDNMTRMMVDAFTELEIKYGEFIADIEDLIVDVLESRGIFRKLRRNLSEKECLPCPKESYDEKLCVFGQLPEIESPFQMFMRKMTDLTLPATAYVLESNYAGKEIKAVHMVGHM